MIEFKGLKASLFMYHGNPKVSIYGNGAYPITTYPVEELRNSYFTRLTCNNISKLREETWEIEALAMFLAESAVLKPFVDKIIEGGHDD